MSNKQTAIACINYALGHAVDNLYRATHAFGNYSEKQLNSKYGQSDDTPNDILKEYQSKVSELENALKWLESK